MKGKKKISVLLAATLALGAFAGCGKKQENTVGENGEYVPGKELELTVWNAQGTDHIPQEASSENIPMDWLKEKTKVTVKNIYGNDGGQWDTKLSRLIAGDSMPDLFYVAAGQGASHFRKLYDAKKVYTLDEELLKTYAPNVWNRIPKDYWDLLTVDGKILGIPFGLSRYDEQTHPDATPEQLDYLQNHNGKVNITNATSMYIRDDIAKKLWPDCMSYDELCAEIDSTKSVIGRKMWDIPINTTDDYIKMFRDINAMNLTENGKKVYAFGYNGGDLWVPFTCLGAGMYGYATNNYISAWNPKTQEIELPLLGETVKQAAKIQNQLIREKVFDPESLIQTSANFTENVLNGRYAVTNIEYAGGLVSINSQLEELGKSFRYRPLVVNIPQQETTPLQYYKSPWTAAVCLTTELDDNDAKQVLNWINTMFSDEFEEISWWGRPEDGLYTEENGVRKYTDDRFNKIYIEGDSSALSSKDCKGIGTLISSPAHEFYIIEGFDRTNSRWNPKVMRGIDEVTSSNVGAYTTYDFEDVQLRPQCNVYDAPYANIEECVDFWAMREQWESPFKISLGADTEEAFEKQWNSAIDNMKAITDLDKMAEKMTEIAREEAKNLSIESEAK